MDDLVTSLQDLAVLASALLAGGQIFVLFVVLRTARHMSTLDSFHLHQKMLSTDVSQLAEARSTAKDAITAYDKAEAKCKEAAAKYDEASRLKLNDKFKEYLALKVKEYNKRAEMVTTAKGVPQALIDSESREGWVKKANDINEKVDSIRKDADDLGAQAEKIQKDNPDIFKS